MPQPHPVYRRTPLPPGARRKVGWLMLCWMLIVFSPFVGFALHGKVEERGLVLGLYFALLPLCGLLALRRLHRAGLRQVPPDVLGEWRHGRLVPPEGAPPVAPPLCYAGPRHWIELRADGVLASRSALLNLGGEGGIAEAIASLRVADAAGQYFVPWAAIDGWEIDTDGDGPDFHRLRLRPGGSVLLRRFRARTGPEAGLLDGVRSIGRVPVLLKDDLTAS